MIDSGRCKAPERVSFLRHAPLRLAIPTHHPPHTHPPAVRPATPRRLLCFKHRCGPRAARVTTPAVATHCHGTRTPRVTMPSSNPSCLDWTGSRPYGDLFRWNLCNLITFQLYDKYCIIKSLILIFFRIALFGTPPMRNAHFCVDYKKIY